MSPHDINWFIKSKRVISRGRKRGIVALQAQVSQFDFY